MADHTKSKEPKKFKSDEYIPLKPECKVCGNIKAMWTKDICMDCYIDVCEMGVGLEAIAL